jgi:hypothetical protein
MFEGLGFELRDTHLQSKRLSSIPQVHFVPVIFFGDGGLMNYLLQTAILQISASQIARITEMSTWCPPSRLIKEKKKKKKKRVTNLSKMSLCQGGAR